MRFMKSLEDMDKITNNASIEIVMEKIQRQI
jgi:hypothetical protein